jgi:hypothetical protein
MVRNYMPTLTNVGPNETHRRTIFTLQCERPL